MADQLCNSAVCPGDSVAAQSDPTKQPHAYEDLKLELGNWTLRLAPRYPDVGFFSVASTGKTNSQKPSLPSTAPSSSATTSSSSTTTSTFPSTITSPSITSSSPDVKLVVGVAVVGSLLFLVVVAWRCVAVLKRKQASERKYQQSEPENRSLHSCDF
ncbi:hypothetical protein RvY_02908 [Ramazzottius varieornatus]|uniref:Uncharacterized protein n=1 Tax=Ramazzottius varieornatus TaxID=947166 RepID=A0A1D1US19_RAMVA|nr:hypothetical protein RvY_02908 [Ramazzottius varieornatus]